MPRFLNDHSMILWIMLAAIHLVHIRRTLNRAERTKNAALTGIGLQDCFTVFAFVKENARICRHLFFFPSSAFGTGDHGCQVHIASRSHAYYLATIGSVNAPFPAGPS